MNSAQVDSMGKTYQDSVSCVQTLSLLFLRKFHIIKIETACMLQIGQHSTMASTYGYISAVVNKNAILAL